MYSKGISWIDDCRIPFVDEGDKSIGIITKQKQNIFGNGDGFIRGEYQLNTQGRFPSNILVSDDMLNDGIVKESKKTKGITYGLFPNTIVQNKKYEKDYERGFNDKGTNSRYYDIDKWFDKIIE
jgi:hypothetical protein